MSKLLIFDLDGVLVNAKEIHYKALNDALSKISKDFVISLEEHTTIFDGLNTKTKLEKLTELKGLPNNKHEEVWTEKQRITKEKFLELNKNDNFIHLFKKLKEKDIKIACCSNSIRKTIYIALSQIGIIDNFDLILSNEDVVNTKPHPEIYWKAMSIFKTYPANTFIVEDSPHGLMAAYSSNAHVLRVKSPEDIAYNNIINFMNNLKQINYPKWVDKKLNILIPMSGAGSRFEKAGYTFPKPLIDVSGKPMIQVVVDNIGIEANYIYIVQKSHRQKYNLDALLNLITPNCKIIEVDGITEGAACSALLAKEHINNDSPLFFANSDQFAEWNSNEFLYKMQETNADGGIVSFKSTHPKWSFAKLNNNGLVAQVAEKNPISDNATVGYYYWKLGSDFVKYAEQMIDKNIRVNNEFYVCPVFNEAIRDGKLIHNFKIDKMWGLGTPEDLEYFVKYYKNS